MDRRARTLAGSLLAWTVFVWGNRVMNAVRDGDGPDGLVLSGIIGAAATLFVVGLVRAHRSEWTLDPTTLTLLRVLPTCTLLIWAFRGVDIALGDHSVGFIAVHLLLALVSMVLAVLVWRALPDPAAAPTWSGDSTRQ